MKRRTSGCCLNLRGLAVLTLAAGLLFSACGVEPAGTEPVSEISEVQTEAVSQTPEMTPEATPAPVPAAEPVNEPAGTAYGLTEIPANYGIYKNAAGNFSFLYARTFTPEEMEDVEGAILYTDAERINYVCVFSDFSDSLTTEGYLEEIKSHFDEVAEENNFEIWEEPVAAEPLTINGRTLQGIRYGYEVEGSRREYTDYIEAVDDGRTDNIIVYEQHVVQGSDETASLVLADAVASFAPQSGFYEEVPVAEPAGSTGSSLAAENSAPVFQIEEGELIFTSDVQDFSVVLPEYVTVTVGNESGDMTVYCSGNGDYPTVSIFRLTDRQDAEDYLEELQDALMDDEDVTSAPEVLESFGVNGRNAYRFSYYMLDGDGDTIGRTTAAVNTVDGIAVFDASYYDYGMEDLNRVMERATESFRSSASAYTG